MGVGGEESEDRGLGIGPKPQSPIPNPQSPFKIDLKIYNLIN